MDALLTLSDALFAALNGLAGRSWLLDSLIALPVDNPLVKGGPIGAAFVYAWHSARDDAEGRRRRAVLLVALGALVLVLAATKTIGDGTFLPRPYVQSQQAWHLDEDGALAESPRLAYRQPLAGGGRDRFEGLQRGDVMGNDLVSFPSDHGGFFVALSLGILLACRAAGLIALAWTMFAILVPRIVTGMHSPLDIAAGAAIGAGVLLPVHFAMRRFGRRLVDPVAGWTLRHQALGAAFAFIVAFEAANALENVRELGWTASAVVERLAG